MAGVGVVGRGASILPTQAAPALVHLSLRRIDVDPGHHCVLHVPYLATPAAVSGLLGKELLYG